jgi:hypothetical protein
MIKYNLALQTPTIILPIVAKDSAGNTDRFEVEFKRYDLEKSKAKLKEFDVLYDEFNKFNLEVKSITEDEIDIKKEQLQKVLADLDISLKEFTEKEVVSFRNIKCRDASGKVVLTLKNTALAEDDFEQWGEAKNCTHAWFEHFWSSTPYKEAINKGMLSAIRNTSE